ncbi:MAG: PIG-L family deacetylase, partial [Spirochaetia bacterium]|nr:PIG-L family deacetylase [Spirochaetia bacterium]
MSASRKLVVLAAGAHPDDIEIMMAGTLILFKEAGAEIHMLNVLNGSCGTAEYSRKDIIRIRWKEAREAAKMIGATIHPPLFDDLGIFYDAKSQARVAARIREIKPDVVLTQSPEDYMEDHMITVRHIVTGFFCKGMRNLPTNPKRKSYQTDGVLYHALPHGLRDGLGKIV